MFISTMLDQKGHDILSIEPDCSVYDALEVMENKNVGALLVMKGGKLLGLLSERDYARKIILKNRSSKGTKVKEVMSTQVICVGLHHNARDCMRLMTNKKIRHLPVVEDGVVHGVISIGDVVRSVIDDLGYEIEHLELYIHGTY